MAASRFERVRADHSDLPIIFSRRMWGGVGRTAVGNRDQQLLDGLLRQLASAIVSHNQGRSGDQVAAVLPISDCHLRILTQPIWHGDEAETRSDTGALQKRPLRGVRGALPAGGAPRPSRFSCAPGGSLSLRGAAVTAATAVNRSRGYWRSTARDPWWMSAARSLSSGLGRPSGHEFSQETANSSQPTKAADCNHRRHQAQREHFGAERS
jgi:hypothetical protein